MSAPIYVNRQPFFGRVEEQKQFRALLSELRNPPPSETLPYVILLYGDGGIGKSTLARRFQDIVMEERPFKGQYQTLWLDWEDEKQRSLGLNVGREHISPETVFDSLHTAALRQGWGRHFEAYQTALKSRVEAEREAAAVLISAEGGDELAPLRAASADVLARLIRTALPIGDAGENLARLFLDAGIRVSAQQATHLRATATNWLRARLKADHFNLYLHPHNQLALALAEGLRAIAAERPLLLFLDTYEIVDHADLWLRDLITASGPRMAWILAGRNDLARSRRLGSGYFKGYSDSFSRRLLSYDMRQLAQEDLQHYFAHQVPSRTLDESTLDALTIATRGIPLAIRTAADIWGTGAALESIIADINESTPRGQIVTQMTERYLLHCLDNEADRCALYALALARGNIAVLQAMLRPAEGSFDLDRELARLERAYASVHREQAQLHDEPAAFLLAHLRDPRIRSAPWLQELLQRAITHLKDQLARLEQELPRLEDRCEDETWVKAALDLTDYLFWLEERQGWAWLTPRLVESLAYSRELRRGLLATLTEWKPWLSPDGQKRLKIVQAAGSFWLDAEDEEALLQLLHRAPQRGWLGGPDEAERLAILALRQGQLLTRRKHYAEALPYYEQLAPRLPAQGEALQKQLAQALYELSSRFLWPDGARSSVRSEPGLRASQLAVTLDGHNADALYNYAVALDDMGRKEEATGVYKQALAHEESAVKYNGLGHAYSDLGRHDEAIVAFQQAIDLDPQYAYPHNNLGLVYSDLGRHDEAIAAFQHAIDLDPQYADPHHGLGLVYSDLGRHDEAIAAFQHAIDLNPQFASPHHNLGLVYLAMEQHDEAIAAFQRAITLNPQDAYLHLSLGLVYHNLGRHAEAIVAFQHAIDLDPQYAYPHTGLGNVHLAMEQHDEAIAAFQRAIDLDPQYAYPHTGLGLVYSDLGRHDEAIAAFQRAIDLDPQYAYLHLSLGLVYSDLGRHDEAIAAFQHAIDLNPQDAASHATLAGLYRTLGREAEYHEHITIAHAHIANENEYSRACFEAICGHVEEALALLEVALNKRQASLAWARRDPDFARLRDDPRFKALVGG